MEFASFRLQVLLEDQLECKCKFYFNFSSNNSHIQKITKRRKNKKKKHDKILMLAKSKLDSMETLVSQALIDMKISHEEFNAIIREKQKYERMKENVKNVSECSSAEKEESIFCVCMHKMDSFALFTANVWRKSDVEAIEYSGKIWINQGHLQEKLDIANISDRSQYYSDEFKKMRCKIQECGNYVDCLFKIF